MTRIALFAIRLREWNICSCAWVLRKEGTTKQQAPPELLEEVFELNESLDELREARAAGGDVESLRERLVEAQNNFQEKMGEVDAELEGVNKEWDSALDANAGAAKESALLARMNEILNRRSYIRNLVAQRAKRIGIAIVAATVR